MQSPSQSLVAALEPSEVMLVRAFWMKDFSTLAARLNGAGELDHAGVAAGLRLPANLLVGHQLPALGPGTEHSHVQCEIGCREMEASFKQPIPFDASWETRSRTIPFNDKREFTCFFSSNPPPPRAPIHRHCRLVRSDKGYPGAHPERCPSCRCRGPAGGGIRSRESG